MSDMKLPMPVGEPLCIQHVLDLGEETYEMTHTPPCTYASGVLSHPYRQGFESSYASDPDGMGLYCAKGTLHF